MINQTPIYVINMAKDVERMRSMSTQLSSFGLDFERVEAVDGRALSLADKKQLYSDFWYRLFHGRSASNGEIGVSLSHREVYKKMVAESVSVAMIFEDDIELMPQFAEQLTEIESTTRDFDMVQLFSFRQPERELRAVPSGLFEIWTFKNLHASSAAYLLRMGGARKLLSIPKVRVLSDRWCWMSAMSGLKCCAISPFPIALDERLSSNSSVFRVGQESSKQSKSNMLGKRFWRVLVLPWLNFIKIMILRLRGL